MTAQPRPHDHQRHGLRQQYHLRPSERGVLAWDVNRLILLTAGLEPEMLPLDALPELREPYWFGEDDPLPSCLSIAEHARLIQEADLAFPIIIDPDGRVMDGMHRICKAWLIGQTNIAAFRLPRLPPPDYIDVAPDELPYDI